MAETSRLKPFDPLKPPCAGDTASHVWLIKHAVTLETSHDRVRLNSVHSGSILKCRNNTSSVRAFFAGRSRRSRPPHRPVSSLNRQPGDGSVETRAFCSTSPLRPGCCLTAVPRRPLVIATRLDPQAARPGGPEGALKRPKCPALPLR